MLINPYGSMPYISPTEAECPSGTEGVVVKSSTNGLMVSVRFKGLGDIAWPTKDRNGADTLETI